MRLRRLAGRVAIFLAGALTWEAARLLAMNRADREDLVTQMVDAQSRAHPIDLPARRFHFEPTPRDVLEEKAAKEFERCGGHRPQVASAEFFAPVWIADKLVHDHDRWKEDGRRSMMSVTNSVFALRAVQLCRSLGGCGPGLPSAIRRAPPETLAWEAEVERTSFTPTTWASAEPFALSLACGMAVREHQGLPAYPNQARLETEAKAWDAGRARRCATGKQIACP